MRLLLIAGLCLSAVACSRSDDARLGRDVKAVGQDVVVATKHAADDPAIRQTGDELKHAGEKADREIKSAAEKARIEADRAGEHAKETVHDATADRGDN